MKYDIPKSQWSDTVRKRMAYANRRGVPTGPVPLGYRKVRRGGLTFVETDAATAPLVREAFRLAGLKKQAIREIVAALDGAGSTGPLQNGLIARVDDAPPVLQHVRDGLAALAGPPPRLVHGVVENHD